MANREFGTFPITANYELQVAAPFDARSLVKTKAALTDGATWLQADGNMYIYSGMFVAVYDDPDEEKNGLYILTDASLYSFESSWEKFVEDKVIKNLQEQIDNIEVSGGGSADVVVKTFSDLPDVGNENTTYFVEEDQSIYKYDATTRDYKSYGGSGDLDINLIYGGDSNGN